MTERHGQPCFRIVLYSHLGIASPSGPPVASGMVDYLRRPDKEWDTKNTEEWTTVRAGDTKGDTGSIPCQVNGAAGISKSPSVWSESVLASPWHTVLFPRPCAPPGREPRHNLAYGNADRLRDQVYCVANMLDAEMRLARALRGSEAITSNFRCLCL